MTHFLWTLLACLGLSVSPAFAATQAAASCSNTDIQTAIDAAADGDLVTIPAGNCTWTGDVTVPNTKGVQIQGAGSAVGETVITMGTNTLNLQTATLNSLLRVTAIRFIKSSASDIVINITGLAQAGWRIDNNYFYQNAGVTSGDTLWVNGYTWGLIDHNTFDNYTSRAIFIQWNDSRDNVTSPTADGNYVWSLGAFQRGTANAVFIEDNYFNNVRSSNQFVLDSRWAANWVFRNNTGIDMTFATHSGCTNFGRNVPWAEVYNNTNESTPTRPYRFMHLRSSSGVVWGNEMGPDYSEIGVLQLDYEVAYRTNCGVIIWNEVCDGDRTIDENQGDVSTSPWGYKCNGQPGWGPPQGDATETANAPFMGVFAWANTRGGVAEDLDLTTGGPRDTTYMQQGREYFKDSDVTVGVIASRPATCTFTAGVTRDIYISTDENSQGAKIYQCSATDTWTAHWEPYTYPHPLIDNATPPPTIIQSTVPDAQVGVAYSTTITAQDGATPYTFTNNGAGTTLNDSDSECAGLSIATNGNITGTPTTAGICTWTALVTDNDSMTDTQVYNQTVGAAPSPSTGKVRLRVDAEDTVIWDHPDPDTVDRFEASVDRAAYVDVGKVGVGDIVPASFLLPALLAGIHTFSVRACNQGGCSAPSDEVELEVPEPLPPPPLPVDATTIRRLDP